MNQKNLTEMLLEGFKHEFEKRIDMELEPLVTQFKSDLECRIKALNSSIDAIVKKSRDRAKADAAKVAIDLLHESNHALFDLRFKYTQ